MTLDPTKPGINLVVENELELRAIAQQQAVRRQRLEDLPAQSYFATLNISLSAPLTPEEYYTLFQTVQTQQPKVIGVQMGFEGQLPDYGENYKLDCDLTAVILPIVRTPAESESETELF